jgi:hypothetical protein
MGCCVELREGRVSLMIIFVIAFALALFMGAINGKLG